MSQNPDGGEHQITRDRDTIRRWAQEHDAVPVREAQADGETERYRLVPESRVEDSHERADWDAFLDEVEESNHVVVYHDEETEEPFEVMGHDEVVTNVDEDVENRLLEGETVTTSVTETSVIESVVVEEVTIDSELVGSEVVERSAADVELLGRDVTNCEVFEDETADSNEWFDAERYSSMQGDGGAKLEMPGVTGSPRDLREFPYRAEFDVEERWSVTLDVVERYDVESRITDTSVSEADTIEDHDIDVEGLHRSLIESGIVDADRSTDEIMARCEFESELAGTDRINTNFTRELTETEEVVEREHYEAEVTSGELTDQEVIGTREVEAAAEGVGEEVTETTAVETTGAETDEETGETADVEAEMEVGEETTASGTEPMAVDDDVVGKSVVDSSGKKVGMVADVRDDGRTITVDTHPSITERIRTTLGWGEAGESDYPLSTDQIERVTDDEVRLKSSENLGEADRGR